MILLASRKSNLLVGEVIGDLKLCFFISQCCPFRIRLRINPHEFNFLIVNFATCILESHFCGLLKFFSYLGVDPGKGPRTPSFKVCISSLFAVGVLFSQPAAIGIIMNSIAITTRISAPLFIIMCLQMLCKQTFNRYC